MTSKPLRFRTKPLTVEAMQYTGSNIRDILVWNLRATGATTITFGIEDGKLALHTSDGWEPIRPGSWIVRDVANEFSPIDEPIFNQKYEREDQL